MEITKQISLNNFQCKLQIITNGIKPILINCFYVELLRFSTKNMERKIHNDINNDFNDKF